jgi:hypothetical protein
MNASVDGRIGYEPVEMGLGVDDVDGAGVYAGVGVAAGAPLCTALGSADGAPLASTVVGEGATAAPGAWCHDRSRTSMVVVALMCAMSACVSAISVSPRPAAPSRIWSALS